jgi:hypothetical protein
MREKLTVPDGVSFSGSIAKLYVQTFDDEGMAVWFSNARIVRVVT